MNRLSIDDGRGASRGLRGIGRRWLLACALTVGAGCAAQPIASMDPPDSLKARLGASPGSAEAPGVFEATLAAPRARTLEAVAPGAIGPVRSGLEALPEAGDLEAQLQRLSATPTMVEAVASAPSDTAKLAIPPEARRGPGPLDDPSALQSTLAGATETPLDELDKVRAIEDAGAETFRRSTTLLADSQQRLDDVLEGDADLAAELATAEAAASRAAAARLEESEKRLSTTRFAHGPVTFGLLGSPDSARPFGGPGLTAHLGTPGRFPGKVDVGISTGQGAPAFAPLSSAFGAAQSFAGERARTFGLLSEPLSSAPDQGATATAQQPAAARMRLWIADQYGDSIKWWLSTGVPQDIRLGAGAAGAPAPEQTADVDGGLQYDLGSAVAVVAGYRFADDRTDFGGEPFRSSAGAGQQSDERLHVGSLRLLWRFTPFPERRPATAD